MGRRGLAAVHLVSHGAPGTLKLGRNCLTEKNIFDHHADLRVIGHALNSKGDLLIYGCDVARGGTGKALVRQISALAQVNVAASTNSTGSAAMGGDWVLEFKAGSVAESVLTKAFASSEYAHTLAINPVNILGALGASTNVYLGDSYVDSSGNIYITGTLDGSVDFDPGPGTTTLTKTSANSSGDIFVAKYNSDGNLLWAKNMGGDAGHAAYGPWSSSIVVDVSGGVYVGGSFMGTVDFDPGAGTASLTAIYGNSDGFILKLDSSGNYLWSKAVAGPASQTVDSLAVDHSGNLLVGGSHYYATSTIAGTTMVGGSGKNLFIAQFTAAGTLNWVKSANGSTGDPSFAGLAVDSSNNVYAVGSLFGLNFDPGATDTTLTSSYPSTYQDGFIWKLTSAGGFSFAKSFHTVSGGTLATNYPTGIAIDTSDNLWVLGGFIGTVDFDPSAGGVLNKASTGAFDSYLVKLTSAGVYQSVSTWGSASTNDSVIATAITLDASNNIYLAGYFGARNVAVSSTVDFDPGAGIYNLTDTQWGSNFYLKLDNTAAFKWARVVDGEDGAAPKTRMIPVTNGVVVVGAMWSGEGDADPGTGVATVTCSLLVDPWSHALFFATWDTDATALGATAPAPTVSAVTSSTTDGAYNLGDAITITVTFNQAVTVTGTPQLTLETGATDRVVNYASGSGTNTLTFNYTVQAGDTSADLDCVSTSALALNGGTIANSDGTNATLTLAAPGAAGSLGANKALVIDTTAPSIAIGSPSASSVISGGASTVTYTVTYADANFSASTLATGNITLNATGTAGATLGVSGTGLTRTVTLSGITGGGTLGITIAAGTATDTAGNTTASATSATFTAIEPAPTVTTQAVSAIATTTATGNGNITNTGGAISTARGVIFWTYNNTDQAVGDSGTTSITEAGSFATGAFTASLTGLSVNAHYNARAYATSPNGTGYGARVAFWTLANVPSAPTVNAPTATTLNIAVNANGNPASTEFCIQETVTGKYVQADGSLGAGPVWQNATTWGTKTVTGLTTGSTYTFQVKSRNGSSTETAYSVTTSGVPAAAPTVTSLVASGASTTGATVNGTVYANGADATATFEYGLTTGYGTSVAATPGTVLTGAGSTSVSATLSGLAPNTVYHFRAKGVNSRGTTNGSDLTFTTVPGLPTSVTATPGDANASVAFTAPAGAATITSYTVTSNPGSFTKTGSASPLTVTGLTNGTTYIFTVTATNAAGTGSASAASNSVTPKAPQTISFTNPGAQNFGTTPTLTATASSGLTPTFTSSTTSVCTITSGGALTFVTAGTCTINADQAGNSVYGAATTVSQNFVVNAVVPGAPTIGSATAGNDQAMVSFTAPSTTGGSAITGYTVTSSPGGLTATGTASPLRVTGLTNGTAYTFTVTANNSVGTGAASAASNSVTPAATVPDAPTISMAKAGNGIASIVFSAPYHGGSAITGYTVTSNPEGITGTGTASPVVVNGLKNGVAYTFTVTATNNIGTSSASSASDFVIPSPGGQMLIIHDAAMGSTETDIVSHLSAQAFYGNGQTVTAFTGQPAILDGYNQIWDVRFEDVDALTSSEQTAYLAFLKQGGQLFLVGGPLGGARDASLVQLISNAGGGTLTLAAPGNQTQTLQSPFTGPIALANLTYNGASGASDLGHGASIMNDGTVSSAVVWAPGTLSLAPAGGLIAVFNADFMQSAADASSKAFLANLVNDMTHTGQLSPTVLSVDVPSAGNYKAGSVLTFTVHTSALVNVTGVPALPLTLGGKSAAGSYASGSGSDALVFTYTVKAGDNGVLTLGSALDLTSGASVRDADGFPARVMLNNIGITTGVIVDAVAPVAPIVSSISGATVTGTAEANSTVSIYLGSTLLGTAIADASGNWTYTLPMNDTGTLTVTATDAAGNTGGSSAGTTVDTLVPVAHDASATVDHDSVDNVIALDITNAATSVSLTSAASHGTATVHGLNITYTPATGYWGADSFTYTASNANGTSSAAKVNITVKANQPPSLTVDALSDGATTSSVLLTVAGSVSTTNGLHSLAVDGAPVTVLSNGRFSYPARLKAGPNTITLVATDKAGLTTTVTRTITLDMTAPTLTLNAPVDGAVFLATPQTASGSVAVAPNTENSDSVASVTYVVNGGTSQNATLADGAFSFPMDLVAGCNTLEVTATTTAGKTAKVFRTVTLSSGESALTVTDPAHDLLLTANSYTLRGMVVTTAPPVTLRIQVGGQTYTPLWNPSAAPMVAGGADVAQNMTTGTFEQLIPLDALQTWAAVVTATDAQNRTETVVRNLVTASSNSAALYTMADALRALQIANGLITATAEDLAKYDLAPRVGGGSSPDGLISLEDATLVLWLASGQSL